MPDHPDVPRFAVSLRGYDREQVDAYVGRLLQALDDADERAVTAERRVAVPADSRPGGFAELGPHVAMVLQSAAQEAEQLRADAAREAAAVREQAERAAQDHRTLADRESAQARAQARSVLADAHSRAEELLRRAQRHADQRAEEILAEAEAEADALRHQNDRLRAARESASADARASAERLLQALGDVDRGQDASRAVAGGSRVIDLHAVEGLAR